MNVMPKVIADVIERIQNWRSVKAKSDSVTAQGIKLNIFQKGILSLIFTVFVGVTFLAAGQVFSSWLFITYIKHSSIALLCAYGIASTAIVVFLCVVFSNCFEDKSRMAGNAP